MVKEIEKKLNVDEKYLPPKDVRREISGAKNRLLNPDQWFDESAKTRREQTLHDVFLSYEQTLREYSALDFDDLLVKTLELFMDHPPVLEY